MLIRFKIVDFDSPEYHETLKLRNEVMRKPLGLTLSADDVKFDHKRTHIAGYFNDNLICACSLGIFHQKICHIFSFCVKQEYQNQGIGRQLMSYAEKYAQDKGVQRLYLEGRKAASPFYSKCGFVKCGHEYIDMNIVHQDMRKDIK